MNYRPVNSKMKCHVILKKQPTTKITPRITFQIGDEHSYKLTIFNAVVCFALFRPPLCPNPAGILWKPDPTNIRGVLKGFDQATNIILDESHERVYSTKEGVQQLVLGLYIIRGDNISVVGELDEELDSALDLSNLRAHPLKPVIH
ncbi:hypothetical protein J1N35_004247 [Gossypium stocksii]|uniref:U6 snRNA-associated Sm-like protein LSm8 n=1 Tax=Gossypium stocksii TaxID=47602 RepID=A0A9D3WCE9_9ROSI|nr:hypothetical protein J1N35_004247 [Gossypium stocksii]